MNYSTNILGWLGEIGVLFGGEVLWFDFGGIVLSWSCDYIGDEEEFEGWPKSGVVLE